MCAEPGDLLGMSGQYLVHFVPESGSVVGVTQVNEFVDDEVVQGGDGSHGAFPVEIEVAPGGAGSPAVAEFHDLEAGGL